MEKCVHIDQPVMRARKRLPICRYVRRPCEKEGTNLFLDCPEISRIVLYPFAIIILYLCGRRFVQYSNDMPTTL